MPYYSFYQHEIDNGQIVYTFKTDFNKIYTVYFDPSMYVDYIGDYPNLLTYSYGFGFYCEDFEIPAPRKRLDPQVSITIHAIILDFLAQQPDETFLLYHCDYADNMQKGRSLIFEKWFENSDKYQIEMFSLEVDIPPVSHYMGFLSKPVNNLKEVAKAEFELFSVNLGNGDK